MAIELDQARALVLDGLRPLAAEPVELGQARGRFLAAALVAAHDSPRFAGSAMDGFAAAAGPAGRTLALVGESRAGRPLERPLKAGEAAVISTGAVLPDGADGVVELERATMGDGSVTLERELTDGLNVRLPGEDMQRGAQVLAAGTRLGAPELAVAAAAGAGQLSCARRPRVALLITGDELVDPGRPLAPGQIPDSNGVALAALAADAGASVSAPGRARDDLDATRAALEHALAGADVVVVSGGVSVGPHDHVKRALEELDVCELFWGVRIKPGRPTYCGRRGSTLVFGLPGNPVSAMVIFILLVRPALLALQGAPAVDPRERVVLLAPLARNAGRTEAVRVALRAHATTLGAEPTGPQGSHVTTSMLGAAGVVLVPPGDGVLPPGSELEFERW